jgi:cobyrinic acid a,c-diamide synthase
MGGLVIAGDRSGAGKTTVTMALLSALRARGTPVQAFKVGPDYIDPMFHRAITGRPAYNLDPVLTSEAYVQQCFQQHRATVAYAVVEGVMGLFDGAGGTDWGSTAHIARLLGCPVLLVVDCARLSRSLAAIVHGFQTLDPRVQLAGVVLNRVGSDRHLAMLKAAIAPLSVPILGVLRRDDAVTLPDRHLGLVPTDELPDLPERFRHLAALGQRCFDWPKLESVLRRSGDSAVEATSRPQEPSPMKGLRIGVARDRAFNFYYEDNLASLTRLGADLVPFSPLTDEALPPDLHGLILGGGFPEMFAAALSANQPMRAAIGQHLAAGLPTYAECGGLMYLCQTLVDFEGQPWPLVGTLPATTTLTGQLTLGYRHGTVARSSPLVTPQQQVWGHEFHRSAIAPAPPHPLYQLAAYPLPDEAPPPLAGEGWASETLHGSYLHLHWGDRPELPYRFLQQCDRWRQQLLSGMG